MSSEVGPKRTILVVEDVWETRQGIERLLRSDGYQVTPAGDELEAIASAAREAPDLILISLPGPSSDVVLTALRIRAESKQVDPIPIVAFCIESLDEGEETVIDQDVYLIRPDNFNQLRGLLRRVLNQQRASIDA